MILKRYLTIGLVLFLLVISYFLFFYEPKIDNDYDFYYNKLVSQEIFDDNIIDFDVNIQEIIRENSNYDYVITFENFIQEKENVKILILDEDLKNNEDVQESASFGIIGNYNYNFYINDDIENNVIKGCNLVILDNKKVDYFLIYFSGSGEEFFYKIEV